MAQNQIHMPSSGGGLMHYSEEYKSSLMFSPAQIILFIILIIAFVAVLKIFF